MFHRPDRHNPPRKELGNGGPQERDWKGIGTALLVIMFICSLIALAVFIFTPMTAAVDHSRVPIDLNSLGRLRSPISNVRFAGNDSILYEEAGKGLVLLSLDSMNTEVLVDEATLLSNTRTDPSFDLRYIAHLKSTSDEIYRKFNTTYTISIFDRKSQVSYKVGVAKTDEESQRIFRWNPVGNDYIFWQDGNLYYSDSAESATSVRISSGGTKWMHGIFDWIYEEEIYGRDSKAVWWSVKGEKLAFFSREKTNDKSVTMESYSRKSNYPIDIELAYPKTHEKRLPSYVINIWDKKTRALKQMDVQLRDSTAFHYAFNVKWIVLGGEELLVATWANRIQTQISITICDQSSGMCKLIFEYKYPSKTWAEPKDFKSLYSDDAIYIMLPRPKPDGNSYQHIAKLLLQKDASGQITAKSAFLSLGNYDIEDLISYDAVTDTLYYRAYAPSSTNLHLFSTKGSPTTADVWKCVSCMSANCTYQTNTISPDLNHVVTMCRGPAPVHYYLSNIVQGNLENTTEILRNEEYEQRLATTMIPIALSETVPLTQGFEANVKILLPPDQPSRSTSRSLPVLLKVYAGPGTEVAMATDEFLIGIEQYLVTSRNYAVVTIDGRGCTNRGWNYRSAFYGALGTVEIDDQIEGIRQVIKRYPFLDANRLSVYGWSYGGYAAALLPERAPESFFKCAVCVAPVANFLYYDATYTERYMGNADNSAYNSADISKNVEHFKKTRLLLVHGLYDDNVHFQNSAMFMEALQENNIDFDVMVYPNQDHQISRRQHLYHKMASFLDQCAKI